MTTYSITKIIEEAKLANNGRLNSMAMTGPQKRAAEKAVERGAMTKHFATFPGYGGVWMYQLTAA